MSFDSLGLPNSLIKALGKEGFAKPYPIQAQAIPPILAKKDLLGIAKTGSGKTASYVLPILTLLQHKPAPKNRHIQALVLVPTRELASQVFETFKLFSAALSNPIKCLAVFGGASINPQMIQMQGVRVLISTPGRLIELKESNAMNLSEVELFVLDEADKMLNLGFRDEMDKILSYLPQSRQNLLFSATLSKEIEGIHRVLLRNPVEIKIEEQEDSIELIDQAAYLILEEQKGPLLRFLIKTQDLKQVLIFTSTVYKADQVAEKLTKNGFSAEATHSKKSQRARNVALADFKEGKLNVLVATDLLSRGIDIEHLPVVINYELPRSPKDFIHRIGRTGRAEKKGQAITFVMKDELHHFKVIQKKMGKWIKLTYTDDLDLKGF